MPVSAQRCFLVAILATLCPACPAGVPFVPPAPDACSNSADGSLNNLEIGDGTDASAPFHPFVQGDSPSFITGGQGLRMFAIRLRLQGSQPPTCVRQTTAIYDEAGLNYGQITTPLKTYADAPGARTTRPLWLAFGIPDQFRLHVQAGTLQRDIHLCQPCPLPSQSTAGNDTAP